jgi:hypothetical protein
MTPGLCGELQPSWFRARAAGLKIRKLRYMNTIGFFGWWANARILRREAQSERQIQIFDRFVVPLMSRLEDVARPPFGQSLFAVLQKPRNPGQ